MTDYKIDDIIKKYNSSMIKLISIIESSIDDPIVDTAKREVLLGINADRTFLLTETGPYVFEYRDYIFNDKWDDFIVECNKLTNTEQHNKIFKLLFNLWTKFNDQEKKIIIKLIKTLLSEYSKYLTTKN